MDEIHFAPVGMIVCPYMRHNQNPVLKRSTQNHEKNEGGILQNCFWLGLPLTNLHLPESVLIVAPTEKSPPCLVQIELCPSDWSGKCRDCNPGNGLFGGAPLFPFYTIAQQKGTFKRRHTHSVAKSAPLLKV